MHSHVSIREYLGRSRNIILFQPSYWPDLASMGFRNFEAQENHAITAKDESLEQKYSPRSVLKNWEKR